jgi:predicted phage terminase large subunit-like protein
MACTADILIFGGGAGGGKSWSLLLEGLRHVTEPRFNAVIFRRTMPEVRNSGGLWDESKTLYAPTGARAYEQTTEWVFPSGANVKFAGLQYEQDLQNWTGSQITLLGFDQLETFTEQQFFYLMSRNRSRSGIRPYIRATCNPQPGWLADFIGWWIDPDSGLPIPERSGVVRWFVRENLSLVWGASWGELRERFPYIPSKSVTFIPANVYDNPILLDRDPGYLASLHALSYVDRERLLHQNWKIRPTAGTVFPPGCMEIVDPEQVPEKGQRVRYWDKANSIDGDYTAGARLCRGKDGVFYIEDMQRVRALSSIRDKLILSVAQMDSKEVQVGVEQEGGAAGKESADATVKLLTGWRVHPDKVTGDKVTRADVWATQAQAGRIKLVRGAWNGDFLSECYAFPTEGVHDDQVDAVSGAFKMLTAHPDPVRVRPFAAPLVSPFAI